MTDLAPNTSGRARAFEAFVILLLLFWLLPFRHSDLVRAVSFLAFAAAAVAAISPKLRSFASEALRGNYTYFVVAWLLLLFLQQLSNYVLGLQGFDFAIFSQVIESVSTRGGLYTSFVQTGWVNFLTHHFSPILYVPGLLGFLDFPGSFAAICFHVACIAAALFFFVRFALAIGFERRIAVFLVVLLCLNPTFRVAAAWEVHDELFALPFIGLAYDSWARNKPWRAFVGVAVALACKENLFFFAIAFGLVSMCLNAGQRRDNRPYVLCLILGFLGAIFYFYAFDFFWARSFDLHARLAPLSVLLEPELLRKKIWFLFLLLIPCAGLSLLDRKAALLSLPAGAFLGPILLTNFEAMYHPYNYYGVVPTYILCLAAVQGLAARFPECKARFPAAAALAAASLALCFAAFHRPTALLVEAWKSDWLTSRDLQSVPAAAMIVADDYSFPFLLDKERVVRLWTATRRETEWEYLILRKGAALDLPPQFEADSEVCSDLARWTVRCRRKESKSVGSLRQ